MGSTERFGFEWQKYCQMDPNYKIQFEQWIYPLTEEDFKNKKVLDAGCGMGRNSYWAKKWGAKEVVAFDYDECSVKAARQTLREFNDVKVEFKSIYNIGWKNEFDIVFSIGVIHHLGDPQKAIKNLVQALKPGGKILIHVYSYEGNEWILRFVNPIRQCVTSKLPVGVVHFISYFASIPLWAFTKIFGGHGSYLKQLSSFKFWHVHSIVFDQLIPRIANYWRKEEARDLLTSFNNLKDIQIHYVNNNSWTVLAKKK